MRLFSPARRVFSALLAVCILILATGSGAFASSPVSSPQSAPLAVVNDGTGPQFYSGLNIDVQDDVSGDVYASGQSVTISGNVTGDVIAAAQTITVTGNVDGNVRLAGQDVTISGDVARSGTIFAATVTVTGSFGEDLVGAAGDIAINGAIGRDVEVGVGNLSISGTVGGNLTYNSDEEANISPDAVSGTVERIAPEPEQEPSAGEKFVGWLLGLLYSLVALSLVAVLAGWLFPRLLHRVTDRLLPRPWKALLVGFVASIAVPLVVLLLLATVIGAPLALAVLLVWILLTLATFVFGAYFIGRLIFRGNQHPVIKALVGGLILVVALHIPWLNIVVWLAMVFLGLGAQLLAIYDRRPWRRVPPAPGVSGGDPQWGDGGVQRRDDGGGQPSGSYEAS
ncbi:hypothetical protein ACIQXM_13420 [Arthrobacter sp. NPDC097144]|uniref:hypothetical protein n=1 Tax=Arthrobacter sp. NPDC097144 TaxID=3363946 RepID=UPI003822BB20